MDCNDETYLQFVAYPRWDEHIILCSRCCPTGGIQVSSGALERYIVRVSFILMFLLLCLTAKREISHAFALL